MDTYYIYSTRIQKTYDEDIADILALFKQELQKRKSIEVRLINYHKGLQITYPALIVGIEKGTIELDVHPDQAVVMSTCRYTFLRSKLLKWDLYADVHYVNIKKRAASLRKFSYVEIMAERRNYLRLELDQLIVCLLKTSEKTIRGKLVEISVKGVCLQIDQSCSLEDGSDATLMFLLQNESQDVSYNIKVPAVQVGMFGESLPRYYRFEIFPDKQSERHIAQFMIQRQVEIIRKLKEASDI